MLKIWELQINCSPHATGYQYVSLVYCMKTPGREIESRNSWGLLKNIGYARNAPKVEKRLVKTTTHSIGYTGTADLLCATLKEFETKALSFSTSLNTKRKDRKLEEN